MMPPSGPLLVQTLTPAEATPTARPIEATTTRAINRVLESANIGNALLMSVASGSGLNAGQAGIALKFKQLGNTSIISSRNSYPFLLRAKVEARQTTGGAFKKRQGLTVRQVRPNCRPECELLGKYTGIRDSRQAKDIAAGRLGRRIDRRRSAP